MQRRPSKRKRAEPPAKNRTWQTQVCKQIDRSVSAADKHLSGPAWLDADRLIAELGRIVPAILLPYELSDRIVGLDLPQFPTVLWRLIGSYAVSSDEIPTKRLKRVVFGRVVCLHLGGRTDDALLLTEPLLADISDFAPFLADLVCRLFMVQQYGAAERICAQVLTFGRHNGRRGFEHTSEFRLFRKLSLCFLGRFADAAAQTIESRFHNCSANRRFWYWNDFAVFVSDASTYKANLAGLSADLTAPKQLHYDHIRMLAVLIRQILTDPPDVLTADWLRTKHAAAIQHLGLKWIRNMACFSKLPLPPFRSADF